MESGASNPKPSIRVLEQLEIYRRRLPHWRLPGSVYFITWRIQPGQALLNAAERSMVTSAIRHFDGVRYALHAFAVMDDHVHVIVQPLEGHRLESLVHSWKSFTANRM